ncbi:carboxymuconolactone decarboxylase family protein [Granulicoccus sp. GXG6511]|uniref:carboxymuconolactone decarboxylase family protein n=1 Tax=Granulicoccus sp. GXG6511 TaxID=3381351 RepID=UPI003D7E6123
MSAEELGKLKQVYVDMLGFVPPKVQARLDDMAIHDPELLRAQEHARSLVLANPHLDPVTVQLILVAVLGVQVRDATALHVAAALRAGASEEQIRGALGLAYLFGGQSVANHTPEYLARGRDLLAKGQPAEATR